MDDILLEILEELRTNDSIEDKRIETILNRHNKLAGGPVRKYAKKRIVPYYLKTKAEDPDRWQKWNVDPELEARFLSSLRMKPRRTASGVATITVITKPWKCTSNCLYCPNDVRMPKSYLHDEPACQRAERNYFDPYLQVASRLRALVNMGHITDKIELILLGGTWADYPREYQIWFVEQLFAALNDGSEMESNATKRRHLYRQAGIANDSNQLEQSVHALQQAVDLGDSSYNNAIEHLYRQNEAWKTVEQWQTATLDDLQRQHRINETADHRVVGLVVETRPDTVNEESLRLIRQLGATKLQMGIQSLNPEILALNKRRGAQLSPNTPNCVPEHASSPKQEESLAEHFSTRDDTVSITESEAARAIDLARLFGFKIHTHFMVNLYGSTPENDVAEYRRFMTETPFQPDEVKIYPCALVAGTGLEPLYEKGTWKPYSESKLLDVLAADTLATPEFCRISRMIRDISAGDILAGNKKGNLRQLVDEQVANTGEPVREIRYREISTGDIDASSLRMKETTYRTLHTREFFLQWVTPENNIAGFLRLSLPDREFVSSHPKLPVSPGQAMIREVHVYGRVAGIGNAGEGAQHTGLGRTLVQRACEIAAETGYTEINVISAVGTREYYRHLGFSDSELYLTKTLTL